MGGILVETAALGLIGAGHGFAIGVAAAAGLGVGTGWSAQPRLAVVGDVAHSTWRASAVGLYRLWRDAGSVSGALLAGALADRFGMPAAMMAIGGLPALSGIVVFRRMYETHRPSRHDRTELTGTRQSRRNQPHSGCHSLA